MNNSEKALPPIEVPFESLSEDILAAVIESFLQREGTDYGAFEVSAEAKSRQIDKQIRSGHTKIIFDPNTESLTLVTKEFWRKNILPLEQQ